MQLFLTFVFYAACTKGERGPGPSASLTGKVEGNEGKEQKRTTRGMITRLARTKGRKGRRARGQIPSISSTMIMMHVGGGKDDDCDDEV